MPAESGHVAGLLYDGILSPGDWYAALDALRGELGASVFHFFTLDHASGAVLQSVDNQASCEMNERKLREYEAHFIASDIRMGILNHLPVGSVMLDHEHITARTMSRNAFYCDYLGTSGFRHTLGAQIRNNGATSDFLGFLRTTDRRTYGVQDKALMDRLMGDLSRATRLRMQAGELSARAALGLAALQTLPQAVFVVDGQRRIHHANAAGERLLSQPGALSTRHGVLRCPEPAEQERLAALVQAACTSPPAGGALLVGGAVRHVVSVLPLRGSHACASLRQMPMVLVAVAAPGDALHLSAAQLADLLGLSLTEARLVRMLATGKTVKDFATLEATSWHTARTHLKNALRKTGCHRQAELVQLVRALLTA
ncbi:helix-turn-helix transcriptional regulator [Ottowia sp. GY511]|uniref:Helix-turn-helix transcriptional regulator n=1 Tax=Ottowia flava TaxID=2675430 RepID=A0ABW4KXT7_9BURK|nr:helix-turn-helix transcriptional regulator [Ottowia sp. GY511]TXK31447.1 helix-turn-helix transcriptional regulator [Ottowia sp. GY511]